MQSRPGARGTSPNSRFTESSAKRPRGHPRAFQERRHPSPRFSPRDTRSRGVINSQEKLRTLYGAALASVRHSRGAHTRPKPRIGQTPAPAPIPHRTKMSGRVTGQLPPGPTPEAGRTRCLSARERSRGSGRGARTPGCAGPGGRRSDQDSPSARRPQRGGEGQVGEDTIWQSTAAAPGSFQKPPPGRRGN